MDPLAVQQKMIRSLQTLKNLLGSSSDGLLGRADMIRQHADRTIGLINLYFLQHQRQKGEQLAMHEVAITFDIRDTLTTIIGYSEFLLERKVSLRDRKKMLQGLVSAAWTLKKQLE